jgi:hypothetical protein
MKSWSRVAFVVLMFVPITAFAQYRDLDTAMSNLTKGFGSGETQAIISGISDTDKVMLQFPGLVEKDGFYGRDQAAYLLEGLFNKVKPSGFEQVRARKVSAEGQYYIDASWSVQIGGKPEARELYITLRNKADRWSIVSIRSAAK